MMALQTFLGKVLSDLLAPFSSWQSVLASGAGVLTAVTTLTSKTAWLYLLTSLTVAWLVYRGRRRQQPNAAAGSFVQFVCPGDVYRQRSAIVDYKFVAVDLTIKGLVYTPFMSGFSWLIYKYLHPVFAGFVAVDVSSASIITRSILLTVLALLMADFGFFFAHYLMHRIPVLWHFHEVHHSAEVLTPVTVYRVHPVEEIVNGTVGAVVSALGAATYAAIAGRDVSPVSLFGVNVLTFGFLLFAFQLRHSHVWLSYGPVLSRILISPAQHQIHHSRDSRHWGKNFGFVLAVWDLMFRSLYVPRTREVIHFGTETDPAHFSTVPKLYFLPFRKAAADLARWRPWRRYPRPVPDEVVLR